MLSREFCVLFFDSLQCDFKTSQSASSHTTLEAVSSCVIIDI